ncbi:glycosyltransferase family 4 protein [Smaragdicoccus niigatensis]|uniref:glycosyltransferase family 4 protein n=1 Tax=Smaragdicoccus niigatensis TaxID=359359 RepID=UPI00036906B6|nr:glycosyltransferase family 4 protein [Smaragdicoccus niigatensis]
MSRRRPKPIVLVEFSPSGGLFQFAFQLGEALAESGQRVQLITGPDPELRSPNPDFEVRPVLPTWHPASGPDIKARWARVPLRAYRAGKLLFAWIVLAVVLLTTRPRAVLWQHWRFSFEPAITVAIARALKLRIFGGAAVGIIAHEPLPRSDAKDTSTPKSGRFLTAAFRSAWHSMDVAFVLGPRTREVVIDAWQPNCDVVVIPHGSEKALASTDVTAVSQTAPVALFFGTWTQYKGIDVLLDAFEIVRANLPEARLVLSGNAGADIDAEAVTARARAIGNVSAEPGYVAVEDVPAILGAARVVVTPYIRASQSGVIHLAFTFGRPVVTSDTGDLGSAVDDGVTGLVVAAGDSAQLATAIEKLLRSPDVAEQMGRAGKAEVENAWDVAAERITRSIEGVEAARARN